MRDDLKDAWVTSVLLLLTLIDAPASLAQATAIAVRRTTYASVCQSDTAGDLTIPLPFAEGVLLRQNFEAINKSIQKREENYGDLGNTVLKHVLPAVLKYRGLSAAQKARFEAFQVNIGSAHNGLGGVDVYQNLIVIDEAYFRIGLAASYSFAVLRSSGMKVVGQYNVWNDYFVDSIVQEDPMVYIDGSTCFGLHPSGTADPLEALVRQEMTGWIAFVVLHEASHLLLGHEEAFQKHYLSLIDKPKSEWPAAALELSRQNEFAADKLAIKLMYEVSDIDISTSLADLGTFFQARDGALKKRGVTYQTHPDPIARTIALVDDIFVAQKKPESGKQAIQDSVRTNLGAIRDHEANRLLRPVGHMRGTRPADITENSERFLLRDAQLTLDTQRNFNTKCLTNIP